MSRCPGEPRVVGRRLRVAATRALDRALRAIPELMSQFGEVAEADAPEVLARHDADAVCRVLLEEPPGQWQEKINGLLAGVADETTRPWPWNSCSRIDELVRRFGAEARIR